MNKQLVKERKYLKEKSQESEPTTRHSQRILQCSSTKHIPAPKFPVNPRLSISRTAKTFTPLRANNPLKPTVISPFCEVKQEKSVCFPSKARSMERHKSLRRCANVQLKENAMKSQFNCEETEEFIKQIAENLKRQKEFMNRGLRKKLEVRFMWQRRIRKDEEELTIQVLKIEVGFYLENRKWNAVKQTEESKGGRVCNLQRQY
eukprot:TRINITY_DN5176_c0_g3_i2.p1 TRINITY_DN5176_c0_g3~~TRINITY_DN5176_c0_g3_i2.p1  ORF type:complete len:204 (+),score=38.77 TRINITY_DN5176_c0_g3_i2:882-1493(+)